MLALTSLRAAAQAPAAVSGDAEPLLTRWLAQQHDAKDRSCELQQMARNAELRYLACGPAGVWIVKLVGEELTLVDTQDLGGRVAEFFQANGRLWAEVSSVRAIELAADGFELSSPKLPPPTAAKMDVAQAALEPGRILERDGDQIVIELPGASVGDGAHIAFHAGTEAQANGRVYAVGQVVRGTAARARVVVGLNEVVPDSARPQLTRAPRSYSVFAPPRAEATWELAFLARPFIVLEDLGVGGTLDASVGYRFRAPFHVQASLTPLAFGTARAGAAGAGAGYISAAYDTQLFEVGLGVGAQTVSSPAFALDPGTGLLLSQRVRLGARDGASLSFLAYVALFHSSFEFSSLRVEAQIPLSGRVWLRLAGSAGTLGASFGELGLRTLLAGNGDPGSLFLTSVVGWSHVFRRCNTVPQSGQTPAADSCSVIDYDGPMLGAGCEFRL
jgi:hypothetical protein